MRADCVYMRETDRIISAGGDRRDRNPVPSSVPGLSRELLDAVRVMRDDGVTTETLVRELEITPRQLLLGLGVLEFAREKGWL